MRGQLAAQVFVYILGIIVVGAILLVGIRSLGVLNDNKCEAQETQFATELASSIEKNKKYGVSQEEQFTLPCDAQEICFISRDVTDQYPTTDESLNSAMRSRLRIPLIADSIVTSNIPTNVFLQRNDGTYEAVDRFSAAAPIILPTDDPIRCFSGDPLRIRFRGQGQLVEVDTP